MKSFLCYLFLFICCFLNAQEPKSSSFHGRVKSVEEHSFKARMVKDSVANGKSAREYAGQNDFRMEYDSLGLPVRRTSISLKGKVLETRAYRYDTSGLLIEEKVFGDKGQITNVFTYERLYNASGKLTHLMLTASSISKTTTYRYTYDANGNQYEVRETGDGPPFSTIDTRTFNSKSQITRQWIYTPKNEVWGYEDYFYDENGNCRERSVYSPNKTVLIIYRWKYDVNNNLVRYEVCGTTGQNCEAWTYKDEIDQMGNWIRRIEYRNGKPAYVKQRTLTYY